MNETESRQMIAIIFDGVQALVRADMEKYTAALTAQRDAQKALYDATLQVKSQMESFMLEAVAWRDGAAKEIKSWQAAMAHDLAEKFDTLPRPRDGADGRDADENAIASRVQECLGEKVGEEFIAWSKTAEAEQAKRIESLAAEVKKAIESIPVPRDGQSPHPDTIRLMVSEAVDKAVSALPRPRDGLDAAQIVPLDGIDEKRSYPKGTYATWHGGTLRAARDTDPIDEAGCEKAGWQVVADGIAAAAVLPNPDGRNFILRTAHTSGLQVDVPFYVPLTIYRDIYKAGETYAAHDLVTWDGSVWIAKKETADKPGLNDDWKLVVKRGRDGRDMREGPPPGAGHHKPVKFK